MKKEENLQEVGISKRVSSKLINLTETCQISKGTIRMWINREEAKEVVEDILKAFPWFTEREDILQIEDSTVWAHPILAVYVSFWLNGKVERIFVDETLKLGYEHREKNALLTGQQAMLYAKVYLLSGLLIPNVPNKKYLKE